MVDKRRILTAAFTLAVAFGTGYLMQNGGAVAARLSSTAETDSPLPKAPLAEAPKEAKFSLPDDISVPPLGNRQTQIHARRLAALDTGFEAPTLSDAQTPTPFDLACKPQLTISAAPSAMIDVYLSAPCDANARLKISHAALSFTDMTDAEGTYHVSVPAMERDAIVSVRFDGGREFVASALIPDLAGHMRSAIVWNGLEGLHIHALEYGADYGDAGDVWAEAARTPDAAANGSGGFLSVLGNSEVLNPELAEVYTFPADKTPRDGVVRLVVEAGITEDTCNRAISGRTIEIGSDGETREVALELNMPACDAAGGYLVLKNLLQDVKIAAN